MEDKSQLKTLLKTALTKGGPFRMASGGTSDTMLDLSQVLRTRLAQNLLREFFSNRRFCQPTSVGGPLCGSDLICPALCEAWEIPTWFGVRKEPKGRGYDQNHLTGSIFPDGQVLLVEDVCTTGGNLLRAAQHIQSFGAQIIHVFALVDRGGLTAVKERLLVPTTSAFTLPELEER